MSFRNGPSADHRALVRRCVFLGMCFPLVLVLSASSFAGGVKVRGYITSLPDINSIAILDDVIGYAPGTQLQNCVSTGQESSGLTVGVLIEAEGVWTAPHRFAAVKISCDASQFTREISESA